MDVLSNAKSLREQADDLIYRWGLDDILSRYGKVFYTGSYFLDTLVYPDLDIQLLVAGDPLSLPNFFDLGKEIALLDGVKALKFDNFVSHPVDPLPKGLYWGIKTSIGTGSRPWKIDLWAKDAASSHQHEDEINDIARRMDNDARLRILEIKHSLLTPEGRTPVLSGYHIYQAVLFKGLRERSEVIEYLQSQDINIG